jgi:methionyl-tRNA formyltransferase
MTTERTVLRVIVLTHGGAERLLDQLAGLARVEVAGVFLETSAARRYTRRQNLRRAIRYDGYVTTATRLVRKLLLIPEGPAPGEEDPAVSRARLEQTARAHGIPVYEVADFHAQESLEAMRAAGADLGIVYGTNILKESVFRIPRLGSINLHQGLAPYYRGGPPVFWELFNGESEIGITVHFVEPKVDTGAIVVQDTVPLEYDYSYDMDYASFIGDFRARLRERCAQLTAEAVRQIAEGTVSPRPQDTGVGVRYRLPTKKEKDELRRRLRARRKAVTVSQSAREHARTNNS